MHRCPQCSTVGKVYRSRVNGIFERLRRMAMPIVAVYRCHNCNWRGWLLRRPSGAGRVALLAAYGAAVLLAVVAAAYVLQRYWPRGEFQY